jgi:hypothetical protein
VVVQGRRAQRTLQGGEWKITLSRSYYFGAMKGGRDQSAYNASSRLGGAGGSGAAGDGNDSRLGGPQVGMGSNSSGRLSEMGDTVQNRVEGSEKSWNICLKEVDLEPFLRVLVGEGATSVGTAVCTKLNVEIGGGRVAARQICRGGSMSERDARTNATVSYTTSSQLAVQGKYDRDRLSIDFDDRRSKIGAATDYTDTRHWWINGKRVGDCEPPKADSAVEKNGDR